MREVAEAIIANGWSARLTEEVVRKLKEGKKLKIVRELIEEEAKNKDNKEKKPKREPTENDIFCHDFEQRLVEFLGTKVKVVPKLDEQGRQGGTLKIIPLRTWSAFMRCCSRDAMRKNRLTASLSV